MVSKRLSFASTHPTEFFDLTDRLREEVRRSGLRTGRIHLQSLHTTVGLAVNENEPLLLRDFTSMLERLAPGDGTYEHDDFSRRIDIALDEPINGHAHCRQLLLTGFATLLVEEMYDSYRLERYIVRKDAGSGRITFQPAPPEHRHN